MVITSGVEKTRRGEEEEEEKGKKENETRDESYLYRWWKVHKNENKRDGVTNRRKGRCVGVGRARERERERSGLIRAGR